MYQMLQPTHHRNKRFVGFTLLEVLLALVIVATLTIVSVRSYQSYHRQAEIKQVKFDVTYLFSALDSYYQAHSHECVKGVFPEDLTAPTLADLETQGFLNADELQQPSSLIQAYQFHVIDSGQKSKDSNKPIYTLQVVALLQPDLASQVNYYAGLLDAQVLANEISPTPEAAPGLVWERLPNHTSTFSQGDRFWVFHGSANLFTAQENAAESADEHSIAANACLS